MTQQEEINSYKGRDEKAFTKDEKVLEYRVEITTPGDNGTYSSNSIRHTNMEDAKAAARDLFSRWTAVVNWHVTSREVGTEGDWVLIDLPGEPLNTQRRLKVGKTWLAEAAVT